MVATKAGAKKPAQTVLTIDHPAENEQIFPGHYAIRVSKTGDGAVEVSINGGPWEKCRESNGFFWFDWWPNQAGKQKIAARFVGAKKSVARKCTVAAPNSN